MGDDLHGIALAAVAHVLAPAFGEVLVGATHSYGDMFPWGSNPLSDPMLSSDRVRLLHDGADADRVEKIIAVAESDVALRHLRVCWENRDGTYNCGQCPKCIRSQVALRIARRLEACETLPAEIDLDAVRSMPCGTSTPSPSSPNSSITYPSSVQSPSCWPRVRMTFGTTTLPP